MYHRPYDPLFPVVNMDEQPIQLISHSREPLPMRPGDAAKVDYEYIREGMCNAFMFVQPLGGWREVHVSKTKKALDWAGYVKWLVDHPRFANAQRITLVCDNLNTHGMGSLYAAYPAEEAYRLMNKLDLVFTPKHGSWLPLFHQQGGRTGTECHDTAMLWRSGRQPGRSIAAHRTLDCRSK